MVKIEIDTVAGTVTEKEGKEENSWIAALIFICIVGFGIMSSVIREARQKEVDNVERYCSTSQLPKTGYKACDDAKAKLLKRYNRALKSAKSTLKDKQDAIASLISKQNKKCSVENVKINGKNVCDEALKDIKNNEKDIENLKNEINDYERKIQDLNNLKIEGTHIVSTDVLNFRSCPTTECSIIGKLKYGEVVFMQEDLGEWLKIFAKNKTGYVLKKFLWDSRRTTEDDEK